MFTRAMLLTIIIHCNIHVHLHALIMFFSLVHQNYVGMDADKDPFILSVVVTDANNHNVPQYRAVLWRKNVSLSSVCYCHILRLSMH